MVVPVGKHFALYDKEDYVGPIVEKLTKFYGSALNVKD